MNLLGNDDGGEVDFKINQGYADRYDKWRRKELLQHLKDKYGNVDENDTGSSTSEEEDEDAVELTAEVEKEFFKTLSYLKEKNPAIYDPNVRFFSEKEDANDSSKTSNKKKESKPVTIASYQRDMILKEGALSDNEDEKPLEREMTNVEEEEALKKSFKAVLKKFDSDDDEDDKERWGGFMQKRIKTEAEIKKEEDDYREWLAGEKERLDNDSDANELKGLHDFWTDPNLDKGEQFIRDYILKKGFLADDDKNKIPSYDEIVHDSDSDLSADEKTIEKQDDFERKYNFRFEEPDQDFIKRHPRIIESSMRKKDDKRKTHREEVKKRKETERSQRDEELKKLKSLKRKEIMEKIEKLKEITGNDEIGFQQDDVEGDFDPNKHDQRMKELFNDDYYVTNEEEKPVFPDLDDELEIDENWDNWDGGYGDYQQSRDVHCEDPNFNMDCDYDPQSHRKLQQELVESSKSRRGKRRQSKFAQALAREKPLFDPKDKSIEKYIDEYYSLDYEDLIGDIPCRFKYRKVVPNDYGLTIEEILTAPDRELNSWASLKKVIERKPENQELFDVKAYKNKAKNIQKKIKCLPSVYKPPDEEPEVIESTSNLNNSNETRKKKRKMNEIDAQKPKESVMPEEKTDGALPSKKKKKRKGETVSEVVIPKPAEAENITKGESAQEGKKKKNKKKSQLPLDIPNNTSVGEEPVESDLKQKKKKNKQKCEVPVEIPNKTSVEKEPVESELKQTKRKKKRKRADQEQASEVSTRGENTEEPNKKKFKKERKSNENNLKQNNQNGKFSGKKWKKGNAGNRKSANFPDTSDSRLKSFGINPKKFKNKMKYGNKNNNMFGNNRNRNNNYK